MGLRDRPRRHVVLRPRAVARRRIAAGRARHGRRHRKSHPPRRAVDAHQRIRARLRCLLCRRRTGNHGVAVARRLHWLGQVPIPRRASRNRARNSPRSGRQPSTLSAARHADRSRTNQQCAFRVERDWLLRPAGGEGRFDNGRAVAHHQAPLPLPGRRGDRRRHGGVDAGTPGAGIQWPHDALAQRQVAVAWRVESSRVGHGNRRDGLRVPARQGSATRAARRCCGRKRGDGGGRQHERRALSWRPAVAFPTHRRFDNLRRVGLAGPPFLLGGLAPPRCFSRGRGRLRFEHHRN